MNWTLSYLQAKTTLTLENKTNKQNLTKNNSSLYSCNYFALGETKHNTTAT